MSAPASQPKRSGSQKRQRSKLLPVYLTPEEYEAAQMKAAKAGLSASSYGRAVILGSPGPRARRTPPLNAEALAHATAALNKNGSLLNQMLRVLNSGGAISLGNECLSTLTAIREAANLMLEAGGRKARKGAE